MDENIAGHPGRFCNFQCILCFEPEKYSVCGKNMVIFEPDFVLDNTGLSDSFLIEQMDFMRIW